MYEVEGAFVRRGASTPYQSSTATDSTHGFASAHTGLHTSVCLTCMSEPAASIPALYSFLDGDLQATKPSFQLRHTDQSDFEGS